MIDSFSGAQFFLSNFYPFAVQYEDKYYPSVEHAFQAAKTLDKDMRNEIRKSTSCSEAKKLGRKLTLRNDWETIKYSVMQDLLEDKFRNWDLNCALDLTGNELLVEGNHWHDQVWGSCYCDKHKDTPGQNGLGILLMHRRLMGRFK